MPRSFGLALCLSGVLLGCSQKQSAIVCTSSYGGAAQRSVFPATSAPYAAKPVDVGSRFRLKVVYLREPWRAASVNVYAYARDGNRDELLQQGTYLPPFSASRRFGFTGRQLVYSREQRELEYWCELSP
jgi:hypothetical protein